MYILGLVPCNRFKLILEIASGSYYSSIIGYIITNAVKHGYCKKAGDYPYSAYASLLSTSHTLLLRDEVLDWFGGRVPFIEFY